MWGKSEHLTLKKKILLPASKPIRKVLKQEVEFLVPQFLQKNGENATLNNFKTTWKNFRCSDLPHFTVLSGQG
jgi:hypothetical protein